MGCIFFFSFEDRSANQNRPRDPQRHRGHLALFVVPQRMLLKLREDNLIFFTCKIVDVFYHAYVDFEKYPQQLSDIYSPYLYLYDSQFTCKPPYFCLKSCPKLSDSYPQG